MTFDLRSADLDRLNSLTKYPSIPTFHALGAKGALTEDSLTFDGPVLLTEKIDGTNTRVVVFPDGRYVIGSRSELLHARGDIIANPALGIVDAVRDAAERLVDSAEPGALLAFYGEVYGGKVTGASKQYTGSRRVGFRLFDVVRTEAFVDRLEEEPEAIAAWRNGGGQTFVGEEELQALASRFELEVTPRIARVDAMPSSVAEAAAFLEEHIPETRSALDEGGGGRPEGLVARTLDRSVIAKLRFADYRRTLKRRN
ncbi:MAG: hypothetical protein JJ863_21025 [Deltaproteobacteria bacterium]|nr:hypothetical protein [Deltaproteobacteria bacterium]